MNGAYVCSTPVGVMDRFAPSGQLHIRLLVGVLNACRRHGSVRVAVVAGQGVLN